MKKDLEIKTSSKVEITASDQSDQNMFQSLWDSIVEKQINGDLAISIFLFVVVYNFLVFELSPGKEIYVLFPVVLLIGSYFSKYWERGTRKLKRLIGIGFLFLALIWDLIVSISFIPGENGTYSLESVPTILLDILGIISLIRWQRLRN